MTTAYTSLLGLALPVTGELSGTWGDTVNTAITSLLDTAVAGTTSITTDADITLTTTTGASNQARQAILLWNPASGTTTRYITAPAQSKLYTVINASGGTQSIVIRGVGPTTGVTIAKGESAMVAWNGSDFVKVSSSGGALTLTDLTVTGNTILGDAAADTLTVNATSTFASPVNFTGQVKLPSTGRSAAAALTPTNPAFLYGVASTYTDTTSSGTLAPVAAFYGFAQPTLSTSNVTTYTTAATLYIANAPTTGGSATITNPYALYVANGNTYLNGAVSMNGNLLFLTDATYDIGASGATRPRNLYLSGLLTMGGALTVGGNTTLGDAAADTLTVNATVTSNLLFTDNTYDIGANGATRPRDMFLSRNLTVSGSTYLGDDAATDTLSITAKVNTNLLFVDNAYDIGASGANRPKSLYLSSTVYAAAGSFANTGISVGTAGSIRGSVTFYPSSSSSWWHAHNSLGVFNLNTGNDVSSASGVVMQLSTAGQMNIYDQTSTAFGAGAGITFGNQQGSWAQIKGLLVDGSGNTAGDLAFYTRNLTSDSSLTFRGKVSQSGYWSLNANGTFGVNATLSVDALSASTPAACFYSTSNSFTGTVVQVNCQRAASSAYSLARFYSDNGGVLQYDFRGDGAAFIKNYLSIGTVNTSYMVNIQPGAGDATLNMKGGGAYLTLDSTTIGYTTITGKDNGTQRWSIGQSAFGGANGLQFFSGTSEAARFDANRNLIVAGTDLVMGNSPQGTIIADNGLAWLNSRSSGVRALRGKLWNQNYTGGGTQWSLLAQLPATNAGTLDYLHLRVVCNAGWSAAATCVFEIIMGNRNGFSYNWHVLRGTAGNTGIVCYQDGSGNTNVYARINNGYDYIQADILSSNGCNAVYEQSWTTTAPTGTLVFDSGSGTYAPVYATNAGSDFAIGTTGAVGVGAKLMVYAAGNGFHVQSTSGSANNIVSYNSSGTATFSVSNGGAVSKTSGSFRIEHPLESRAKTHQLVHSFIEGPQADLIYRGKVSLINGRAQVNIDEVSGMTEGTFVALCRDVQCFTTNESDWTSVRGSVSGNILTIDAQDSTSTANISWMVIGERQDKHMYETDWTDDSGKVIVEPPIPTNA